MNIVRSRSAASSSRLVKLLGSFKATGKFSHLLVIGFYTPGGRLYACFDLSSELGDQTDINMNTMLNYNLQTVKKWSK